MSLGVRASEGKQCDAVRWNGKRFQGLSAEHKANAHKTTISLGIIIILFVLFLAVIVVSTASQMAPIAETRVYACP